jgi:hypothetical protein
VEAFTCHRLNISRYFTQNTEGLYVPRYLHRLSKGNDQGGSFYMLQADVRLSYSFNISGTHVTKTGASQPIGSEGHAKRIYFTGRIINSVQINTKPFSLLQ